MDKILQISERKIPLSVPILTGNESRYVMECIRSGWISSAGPWVERFEQKIAKYVGAKNAVAVSSGTAALHLALLAAGIGIEDEVIVPTLTFIAPVNAIRYVGAFPIFIDCDQNLNIDVTEVENFITQECHFNGTTLTNRHTGRTVRAVLPVHIFGHPVEMESLRNLASRYSIKLIEDASQSLGSEYRLTDGRIRKTGTLGDVGCFSFNGNKIITAGGGGAVVSDDVDVGRRVRYLSRQAKGENELFIHDEIGFNYGLSSLQAALGIAQFERLDEFVHKKRQNFERYKKALHGFGYGHLVDEPPGTQSNFWLCTFLFEEKFSPNIRELIRFLSDRNVQTRPLWRLAHEQKPYAHSHAHRIERAPKFCARSLSLPNSADLSEKEIHYTVKLLNGWCASNLN